MATLAGTQAHFFEALKQVIELDFDAIKAYEAAIHRLENPTYIATFQTFKGDHQRHVNDLSRYMKEQGQTPPTGPDFKAVLTQGKIIIAALATDHAILRAMKSNEEDTNQAYDNILSHGQKPQAIADLLITCFEDERRHRQWLEQEITQGYNENDEEQYHSSTGTYS